MNSVMKKNQLTVEEYEIDKPDNHKIHSLFDKVYRDCHYKYHLTFEYRRIFDINFTKLRTKD